MKPVNDLSVPIQDCYNLSNDNAEKYSSTGNPVRTPIAVRGRYCQLKQLCMVRVPL